MPAGRPRQSARRATLLGALGLLPASLGCSGGDQEADPSTSTDTSVVQVPGLTATLEQYREDEIQGFISVKTSNRSSSTVQFHDLRLRWPGLTDTEPHVRSTKLAPGVRFDIRVLEGDAACGDPPQADGTWPADAAVAVGTASIDGAAPVSIAVPVADDRSILPKVHRRSCQEQRLAWAADLHFGDTWTPSTTESGAPAVLGSIELRRRHFDGALSVTEVNGSVLLRITPRRLAEPVATLERGEDALSIPILVEQSGNCSPHALIESKKTFIIPIGFALGDEAASYVITVDDEARPLLNTMINESCGLG